MERWSNRVAIVTGASAGIGAAIVKDLLRAGLVVAGLARRPERIEELKAQLPEELQAQLHAVRCDVADPKSVDEAFAWVRQQLGGVDVLVSNAGCFAMGQLLLQDPEKQQNMLQTNVMGAVYCIRRSYESMTARKFDGHIVIVNSVLGHMIFNTPHGFLPELSVYPSTKHALTAMAEVLRQELRCFGTKIKISSISPGLVNTDMVPAVHRSATMLQPEDVSRAVVYVLATPPNVQVHELILKPVGDIF